MNKGIRIISNIVYGIGVATVVSLVCIAFFGSNQVTNPDAMLPITWKERAFIWLTFGAIPMLLASMAVYKFNAIKRSMRKKLYFFLIFLPVFICGACVLYIIGSLIAGMVSIL
ncbi:hypothetical protein CDQ84_16590 [Clostridium thermosuccinogenes]|jgi:hypothetical protein|uniref:Uncharacterized protein n=1 Tax=Clostridium thermosuccinogenes TaxID=84032 RepID=A0A2K2F8E1_9CLOT|nr:hypothetical protein [Pseudoclostridium thermosuccinogenes]AUS97231.1 hypothetical protein CDO33_12765 [Pseudoclostridium thermosuccinogenes]PNT95038.1 hypothetical protein CDQ85_16355 [Pseudoclostridium thermosuccinogenes]PNT95738.1 hypothetical protein CDQ84_16590 [Pseudoclostridium thermosuccinogenes]